jgi:hypothetical protein
MGFDWREKSNQTFIGIVLVMIGLPLEVRVYTDIENTPVWAAIAGPFIFGVGGGMLLNQWFRAWQLRRMAPGEYDDYPEEPEQPQEQRWVWPEDDPNWVAWSQQQVDNPKKPTDDDEEGAQ